MKCVLVVLLASMMTAVNPCDFGSDAIQSMYDRAEVFRKTKTFDTTNRTIPLRQRYLYYYSETTDGRKSLTMTINDEYMSEFYKNNAANEIDTIAGSYGVHYVYELPDQLHFRRDENGEMIFQYLWKRSDVKFTLPSIDAELPINATEEYKQVLIDLKTMRQKMFDFQRGLSKDDLERVHMFDYRLFPNGEFNSWYTENGGSEIIVSSAKKDGKETISGKIYCNEKYRKYNVVHGKVAVGSKRFIRVESDKFHLN